MAEMENVELLIDQVKGAANTKQAVNLLSDILIATRNERIKEIIDINKNMKDIKNILTGNGKPETSVCSRLFNLEKKVSGIYAIIGAVGSALVIYVIIELFKLI